VARPAIAARASLSVPNSMKPNPFEVPLLRSVATFAERGAP